MLNTKYQAPDGDCQTSRQSPARPSVLFLFAICSLLSVSGSLLAAPQYFVIPDTNRVYVVLAAAPADMSGFTVQRQSARGAFENLTPAPVARTRCPSSGRACSCTPRLPPPDRTMVC